MNTKSEILGMIENGVSGEDVTKNARMMEEQKPAPTLVQVVLINSPASIALVSVV